MTELEKAREIINQVDKEMAELFCKRMEAVKAVAEQKRLHGIQVSDLAREAEVIRKNSKLVDNEELKSYFVDFLQHNMDISKNYQHRLLEGMRIAFSGVRYKSDNIAKTRHWQKADGVFLRKICQSNESRYFFGVNFLYFLNTFTK